MSKIRQDLNQLAEEIRRRQEAEERAKRLRDALDQGRKALENKDFTAAKSFFESARDIDRDHPEAWAGLKKTLYQAGQAEEQQHRFREAREYYQALLSLDPGNNDAQVRLGAVERTIRIRMAVIVGGTTVAGIVILVILVAWLTSILILPQLVCTAPGVGGILCSPTPTCTPTMTPTMTPTPTFTPTATPTSTATSTATPTVTLTPTSTPVIVRLTGNVRVYTKPDPDPDATPIHWLNAGEIVQVHAIYGDWALISTEFKRGWVPLQYARPVTIPPDIVTPTSQSR